MTKKDYVKFAEIFFEHYHNMDDSATPHTWNLLDSIVRNVAQVFASDNPRFDSNRFFEACGMSSHD